jgi:hypothetical protein
MEGTEGEPRDGWFTATGGHFPLFHEGQTTTELCVEKGDTKGVLGGKDALHELLFVHLERAGHVLDKPLSVGKKGGLKGLP